MKHIELRKTKPYDIYQPECKSDCNDINCTNCVFDSFRSRGDDCPFRRYITTYPAKEPIKSRPVTLQVDYKCDSTDTKEYQDKSSGVYLRTGNHGLLARLGMKKEYIVLDKVLDHITKINLRLDMLIAHQEDTEFLPLKGTVKGDAPPSEHDTDQDVMVYREEGQLKPGETGNLNVLSFVRVGDGIHAGKEHYHHCPVEHGRLVKLDYLPYHAEYLCPVCKQIYKPM